MARCLSRALGRLEPLDAGTTRLVGSTSNPVWYAEQLAALPAPYRIVRCPELQEAARVLGQRLLAAGQASTLSAAEPGDVPTCTAAPHGGRRHPALEAWTCALH